MIALHFAAVSQVKWRGGSWYAGEVSAYDVAKGEHRVLYDDGDDKTYVMANKTWRLMP